ncbi:MAG: TonB-dependent receptor [Pseudomonadota bacterium]
MGGRKQRIVGRSGLFCGVALVALGQAMGPAHAQSEGAETPAVTLDAITVKARQIEEPLKETPFSVTVFGGDTLKDAGLYETRDLFRLAPNLNFTDSGLTIANLLNIRGIGSSSTFLSPAVTYYVDGVPVQQRVFDQQFLDVDQIEILRGPQGTLFGQNSQAGAVTITTALPTEGFAAEAGAEYGNYDQLRLSGVLAGPLSDTVSGRFSVQHYGRDGDIDNEIFSSFTASESDEIIRERGTTAFGGKLVFEPYDATDIILAARYQSDDRDPTTGVLFSGDDDQANALDPVPDLEVESGGASLTIVHDFGGFELTSITGFDTYEIDFAADITDGFIAGAGAGASPFIFTPLNALRTIDEDSTQWSQEIRLSGTGDLVTWVAGVSALYRDFESTTGQVSPALPSGDFKGELETLNLATFGEVTLALNERTRLIGGLRITNEETDFDHTYSGPLPGFTESGEVDDTLVTGRAALSVDLTEDVTSYVTVARGAKAGGFPFFNQSAAFAIPVSAFEDSSTWSYEAGLKGQALGGLVSFSSAVFFNDTKDEQLFLFNPLAGQFQVENADTETYGAELEVLVLPTDRLTLSGSLALLETEATEDNGGSVQKGNETPYAPDVSAHLAAQYVVPAELVGLPGQFILLGRYAHVGERQIDPGNSLALEDYDLASFRLTYRTDQFDLYGFIDNAFDEDFEQSGFRAGFNPMTGPVFAGVPGEPQLFGVGLRVRF